jgi:3,4-dihydroxy 2-butanone 4-phosphate synthase/GTP cyclohydrolase II
MKKQFCTIPSAIKELKKGNMLIVVDSPARENQGDLIFPAEIATPEKVNFLLKNCRGLVCVAVTKEKAIKLELPLMVPPVDNTETTGVQFTVSVDAKNIKSFGISASDMAKTIKVLADQKSKPGDLARPGHIFPLLARQGGTIERAGHTEATVELARLSRFSACGVLCEILQDDGEPARVPKLIQFSRDFKFPIVSIDDLIDYLKKYPLPAIDKKSIIKTASSLLPTDYGLFNLSVYKSIIDSREHIALSIGEMAKTPILTRIHSQCLTGDVFSSRKCDCNQQLHRSLQLLGEKKQGILIYLNQEGRGIGLSNKIKAYELQDKGLDTVEANEALGLPADARDYLVAAEILKDLSVAKIELLTNNPQKIRQLSDFGVEVVKKIPLEFASNETNKSYLQVKKYKLGHLLKHAQ